MQGGELKSFIVINPLKRTKIVGFLCTGILHRRLLFVSVVNGVETKLLSGRCDKILWMGIKVSLLLWCWNSLIGNVLSVIKNRALRGGWGRVGVTLSSLICNLKVLAGLLREWTFQRKRTSSLLGDTVILPLCMKLLFKWNSPCQGLFCSGWRMVAVAKKNRTEGGAVEYECQEWFNLR